MIIVYIVLKKEKLLKLPNINKKQTIIKKLCGRFTTQILHEIDFVRIAILTHLDVLNINFWFISALKSLLF